MRLKVTTIFWSWLHKLQSCVPNSFNKVMSWNMYNVHTRRVCKQHWQVLVIRSANIGISVHFTKLWFFMYFACINVWNPPSDTKCVLIPQNQIRCENIISDAKITWAGGYMCSFISTILWIVVTSKTSLRVTRADDYLQ